MNVAVTVVSFTTVKPVTVMPVPATVTAVAPVRAAPVRVTVTGGAPRSAEAGAIGATKNGPTVNVTALLTTPPAVTVTFLGPRVAVPKMLNVAVI